MKIVSLAGSNRGEKGTSASLVNYLAQRLLKHGVSVASHYSIHMHRQPHRIDAFLNELKESELLIISAPIYVDLLPSPLIHVLEEIRDRMGPKGLEGRKLLAIIHSGYPEPQQRRPSLGMCRCFGREMSMEWWGGLSFGGTSPISGQSLEVMGVMTKGIRSVLDQTAEKAVKGGLTGVEALVLQDRSTIPVPPWMVRLMMNAMIRKDARKGGVKDLRARPFGV
jgi:multimeric flavodoxin WrbA